MKIEDLATKLNCPLLLSFTPLREDSTLRATVPDPKPWKCRKVDYSDNFGKGATPDEACDAFVESLLESARARLERDAESQQDSVDYLNAMVKLRDELAR